MKLIDDIKSSVYNPAFYSEVLNKPFSYSLKYLVSLMGLLALVATILFSIFTLPDIIKYINEFESRALSYYPGELEITIKDGKVTTNVTEPYFIKMPKEFKNTNSDFNNKSAETAPKADEMENLLVIDTKSPLTVDLFKGYKTAALLGADSFIYYKDNGVVNIQPLSQASDVVINKAKVSLIVGGLMPYIKALPVILVPVVFIVMLAGLILSKLFYLIFGAFLIWLLAMMKNKKLEYKKAYQIGLHAITLGVVLESTIFWFYPVLEFPFLFTILMLAVVWVNLKSFFAVSDIPVPPIAPPPTFN
jgi:hypothetical protein